MNLAAAGLHTQADGVNARFMHARRGFKPERLSTLVSLSRRGSLLVAVATHSPLPDPAARLAAPARPPDGTTSPALCFSAEKCGVFQGRVPMQLQRGRECSALGATPKSAGEARLHVAAAGGSFRPLAAEIILSAAGSAEPAFQGICFICSLRLSKAFLSV
mgnify:CR=1 FL=1